MTVEIVPTPVLWSGGLEVVVDRRGAVDRLPGAPDKDPFIRLAMAFLASSARHSYRGYRADLNAWHKWCTTAAVHPFNTRRHHVVGRIGAPRHEPRPRTNKPMAASSIARRLSAVSTFYAHGIRVEVLGFSPVANVRRPKVSDESTTVRLSADELVLLLDVADAHSPRWGALVSLLAYNGVRIDEALSADVADYTYQRSHRVLRITRKGGATSTEPLAPSYKTASEQLRRSARTASSPLPTRSRPTRYATCS